MTTDRVATFLERIDSGDTAGAMDLVIADLDATGSVAEVIDRLLAPLQRTVGERWHADRYSVAQEHAISAVVEDALGVLSLHARRTAAGHSLALVCAEGEWHTTPARMAALLLREAGWRVDFLGGSTPAEHLQRALTETAPRLLTVSATLPLSLSGVVPLLEVAHHLQIPVLVGGRAFGATSHRAHMLGADGWAPTVAAGHDLLSTWLDRPPSASQPRTPDSTLRQRRTLTAHRSEVLEDAERELIRALPQVADYTARQRDHTGRDLAYTLQFLDVALLVDDPTVLTDYTRWLVELLDRRGVPQAAVTASLDALAAAIRTHGGELPRVMSMLEAARGTVDDDRRQAAAGALPHR